MTLGGIASFASEQDGDSNYFGPSESRAASDRARFSSAASFGNVTVSRGRPCSSRSKHSLRRVFKSLAIRAAPFVGSRCGIISPRNVNAAARSWPPASATRARRASCSASWCCRRFSVYKGVRFGAKQYFGTPLQLFHSRCKLNLLHVGFHIECSQGEVMPASQGQARVQDTWSRQASSVAVQQHLDDTARFRTQTGKFIFRQQPHRANPGQHH